MKCEDHHTKILPYNCLYLNKGNNSSVKGLILTKLIGYWEFMVLIICTKNELNLTNRYWDMVPDRQKVRTDGMDGRTDRRTDDAKTISLRLRRGIISIIGEQEKKINYLFEGEIEKSVPPGSPLVITQQASRCQTLIVETFFLPYLHTHNDCNSYQHWTLVRRELI